YSISIFNSGRVCTASASNCGVHAIYYPYIIQLEINEMNIISYPLSYSFKIKKSHPNPGDFV
ncbi:hypothetical protein NLN89_14495, partial [Citrobacter portucalensis]|uniref:hypothetical protein n=1 Tax=Citrobacter portucalensis TaxID=1639133 RepID=UPI00226B9E45